MSIIPSQYKFVRTLGEGAFGEVFLLEKKTNPDAKVAMKKVVPKDRIAMEFLKSEFRVLQALSKNGHVNAIKMFGMQTDNITYCMFLEYVNGGALLDKIIDGMSLEKTKHYFRQLVDGLFFLHENRVVHRNIKPENLLLTKRDTLKIVDFGFATFYRKENGEERMLTENCGTMAYAAPELHKKDPFHGPPVDVWSAGVVLAEMIIGDQPWETATDISLPYVLWDTNCYDDEPWRNIDPDTITFLRKMLIDDVEARATIQQIKKDPWLAVEDETTKKYNIVKTLGKGAFGEVHLLEEKANPNVKVAMKKMVPEDEIAVKFIKSEVLVLQALTEIGHVNVIKMFRMHTDNITFALYMEYVDGGELLEKIIDGMNLEKSKYYFRQLVDGLFFLHENRVVHRDIKPENLLLTKTDTLKIVDFGLATFYRNENGEEKMLKEKCGSKPYIAPELYKNASYRAPPVDVWSAGVVLAEMIIGDQPWETATNASVNYRQWISGGCDDDEPWTTMDADTITFLRKILSDDVEARATIQQIKEDPWLAVEVKATKSLKRKAIENERSSDGQQVESCLMEKRQRVDTFSE